MKHFVTNAVACCILLLALPAAAKQIIVELREPAAARHVAEQRQQGIIVSDAGLQDMRAELAAGQDAFLRSLDAAGIDYTLLTLDVPVDLSGATQQVELRYTLVLNGIALEAPAAAIAAIEAMPRVRAVHPVRRYETQLDHSVDYINAPAVYGDVAELTAFDDFREGFEGQGVNISIIDTGIEWSHEMFGGDATPPRFGLQPPLAALNSNEKVIYYLPLFDAVIDNFGHGTHVASTAGGFLGFAPGADGLPLTADDQPMNGVAPQARLMGYQVCNGTGSASGTAGCLSTSIILAIEDSVSPRTLTGQPKPVAHVINMSLGGAGGPDDATSVASDNAVLMGAVVVASAGNSGPGEATVGSPAAGRHVIAVAASNDKGVFPNRIDVLAPGQEPMVASMSADSNLGMKLTSPITQNYVFAGLADTPDQVPLSVMGRICLVERGSTAEAADNGTGLFANKAAQCEAKGAIATVIFNNAPGAIGPVLAPAANPVFTISGTDGRRLLDLGFDAAGVSASPIRLNPEDPSLFEPMITGFSSRGPVQGFGQVKPDVAAPGDSVLAATSPLGVPVLSMQDATRYTVASGTSMAAPHATGAAALVRQAHLDWTPDMVRTALINTATNPRFTDGTAQQDGQATENILTQGGGLIEVFEAVNARALMGVAGDGIERPGILGSHSFGEVPVIDSRITHAETVTVELRDVSGEGGSYDLAVVNNRDLQLDGIEVSISPASVELPAGGSASFTVSASVDGDLIRDTFAAKVIGNTVVFEPIQMQWFIEAARNDGAETLRMPFYLKPTRTELAPGQSGLPPALEPFAGDFTDSSDRAVDFDGDLTLAWQTSGQPVRFEIERSVDGGAFKKIAEAGGGATSFALAGQPDGELAYRMRAVFEGKIGFFVSDPSAAETVIVSRRSPVDISDRVSTKISNVSLGGGVFELDLTITNESAEDFLPLVEFNVVSIESNSGTVRVINADNGGSGLSAAAPALFDYSHKLGGDDVFSAGETSGSRHLRFSDERAELFTFTAQVIAHAGAQPASAVTAGGSGDKSGAGTTSTAGQTGLLKFTVNPLPGLVQIKLLP